MNSNVAGLSQAYHMLFVAALIFLAVMVMLCLIRAIIGPKIADRIVSVNMMGTMIMVIIAILAVMLEEGYLVDICIIYAMISFLARDCSGTKVYMGLFIRRKSRGRRENMAVIEWIRFLAGAVCLLCGLGIFLVEMIGVFRFKYVLNRMHAAAMGDTLGIGFALAGLILMSGFTFTSVKLLLVIVFLWFASPVSSHLIARLEVTTNEDEEPHFRKLELGELEQELSGKKEPEEAGQKEA